MADFLDRTRNVYDDHQDRERQQARQEGYQAVAAGRDPAWDAAVTRAELG